MAVIQAKTEDEALALGGWPEPASRRASPSGPARTGQPATSGSEISGF